MIALAAANTFFVAYLFLMLHFVRSSTPATLRAGAAREDEGTGLILLLAAFAVATSLIAIFALVNQPGTVALPQAASAFAAVPLGWAMVHTLAAVHYAHIFYGSGGRHRATGGLIFPDTPEPGMWDFLYLAFGVGMTAQVSDVVVTSTGMRRAVLVHCVASFFTNTVILALAVNAALAGGH